MQSQQIEKTKKTKNRQPLPLGYGEKRQREKSHAWSRNTNKRDQWN